MMHGPINIRLINVCLKLVNLSLNFLEFCVPDEATDPAAQPIVWISKWVDYSDKYGFGYQLCDEGVGVVFNDSTKLVMLANGK